MRSRLGERLTTHAATVGIVGLGYVGLPRLVVDTRNTTGPLGELPHMVRL